MAISQEKLKNIVIQYFNNPLDVVEIIDMAGDGEHYEVVVKSQTFIDKPLIEQHRMVHEALKGYLGASLHAVKIKTMTI